MTFRKSQYLAETFTTKKRNEKSEKDSDSNDGLTCLQMYHLKNNIQYVLFSLCNLHVIIHPENQMDMFI